MLKPKGLWERTLAERACRAAWSLRRCDRYEDATAAKRDRDAAESHDLAEAARAAAIGRRLVAMRAEADFEAERDQGPSGTPTGSARTEDDDPTALIAALRRTAAGVAWLLARWAELDRALKEPGGWGEASKFAAARLLGLSPESARNHPRGRRIDPPTVNPGPPAQPASPFDDPRMKGMLDAAVAASERGLGDVPTFWLGYFDAIQGQAQGVATSGPAAAKLKALVRSERAKLARLSVRVLRGRAAEDRAGAADRSRFDESRSLSLCLRYATAASRDLHRATSDLAKLRKAADGDGENERPEPPPSPRTPRHDPAPEPVAPGPGDSPHVPGGPTPATQNAESQHPNRDRPPGAPGEISGLSKERRPGRRTPVDPGDYRAVAGWRSARLRDSPLRGSTPFRSRWPPARIRVGRTFPATGVSLRCRSLGPSARARIATWSSTCPGSRAAIAA